jgi:hypothetical protein
MLRSPSISLHKVAQEKDIGLATTHKAVREKLKFFPYKVTKLVKTLVDITSNTFYKCTATLRTHCSCSLEVRSALDEPDFLVRVFTCFFFPPLSGISVGLRGCVPCLFGGCGGK